MLELAHTEAGEDHARLFLPLGSVPSPECLEPAMMGKSTPQKIGQSPKQSFPLSPESQLLDIYHYLTGDNEYLFNEGVFSTIRNNSCKY